MFGSLKKSARRLLRENKTGRVVFNISGEIVMVVVGILIAIAIDNWNNQRKQQERLRNIYTLLLEDINDDLDDIGWALDEFMKNAETHVRLAAQDFTKEELKACDSCHQILQDYPIINIETRGLESLKAFNAENKPDSLSLDVIITYGAMQKVISKFETELTEDVDGIAKYWRDNYDWYADMYLDNYTDAYLEYVMFSPDFRNRVVFNLRLVYDQYVPVLEMVKEEFEELKVNLHKKLGMPPPPEAEKPEEAD